MAVSASRHGSLPLSTPSLYSNVTQSAGQLGDWLPLTRSTNPKLSFVFGQQPLELHEEIFRPYPAVELLDPDQLILLGNNLKAAFIKTLAFDPEYTAVLAFTSESHIEIKAKSDYFPDTQEVEIMSPSPIHETIITWLQKCFITYSSQIGHNDQYVNTQFFTNNWLPDEESLQQVPDIMGFSQSDASIMHKFGHMVKNNLDIKKLIRVSINKDGTFQGPKEHTQVTKSLRKSGSWMNREKFKSLIPPKTSDTMYGPDEASGKFRFDSRDPEHYAEGIAYSTLSAANLKAKIITIMEGFGLEQSMIDKARNSEPELPLNWSAAAMQMSSTICDTAYFCYVDWFNYKYNNKCKGATTTHTSTEVSGKSSQTITLIAPLASGSTERDLKMPKVSKEKEMKNAGSKKKKMMKMMNGKVKSQTT
ncbi:hypothetical protein DFH29DRAFT_875000 [Suillus ampliporus]|nr:hypothetical protein DFH29DRAFT_875000 [Suillus ampliporus]